MLASIINIDRDIEIFLKDEEVEKLREQSIKGEIFELQDVRKICPLELLVDFSQYQEKADSKMRTNIEDNKYFVYLSKNYYEDLKESGWIGTRCGYFKVDVMTEYFAKRYEEEARELRNIKFRWDNRKRIIEKMERA